MSHNRPRHGIILRIICTDSYHRDTRQFAERGHHYIGTLRPAYGGAGLRWHGPRRESDEIETRDRKVTMTGSGFKLPLPVKMWRTEDDKFVYRFDCTCGLDVQRHESDLAEIVKERYAANPGVTRIDIDITTL